MRPAENQKCRTTGENPNPDPMFDTEVSADYIQSSKPTLERWRKLGTGPDWCKLGGLVRYRKSALDAFIEQNTHRQKSPKNPAPRHQSDRPRKIRPEAQPGA